MSHKRIVPIPGVGALVAITWEDAAFDLDSHTDTVLMTTVGWVTKLTRTTVTVAGERGPTRELDRSFTSIPRSLVREVVDVTP